MRATLLYLVPAALALTACRNTPADKPAQPVVFPENNPWIDRGCELITDAELQKMYRIDPERDVLNTRSLPGKAYCLRTWMRPNWKQIESDNEKPGAVYKDFSNALALELIHYGSAVQATERMAINRREQREMYPVDVPKLGDDALWAPSTNTLLVRYGPFILNVLFTGTDTPEGNLEEAQRVAEQALPRLVK